MALIKCPECGREISDAANQCPHCGFPLKKRDVGSKGSTAPDSLHEKYVLDELTKETEKVNHQVQQMRKIEDKAVSLIKEKPRKSSKKKWLIGGVLFVVALLALVALYIFKGSKMNSASTDYPFITEKGIEPFVLGASMKDIPYKGDYYDSIIFMTQYLISGEMDGEVYEWDEQQWEDYKKTDEYMSGWAYYRIINTHISCFIVSESDTLLSLICDSDLKIIGIKIMSDKMQFENGIRVGLYSTELFSKYDAEYACETDTRCMGNMAPPTMGYITPGISNTVGLIAAKKNNITFDVREKYEDDLPIYPVHGTMKHDGIWVMPLEDVKNDYLAYIIIAKDAYPQIYKYPDRFFNMLLK